MKKLNTFIISLVLSAGLFATEQDTDKKLSSWRKISEPSIKPRSGHSAIWTGNKMIIWGGGKVDFFFKEPVITTLYNDGETFDLKEDKWKKIADVGIEARFCHSAIWTGDKMIIWGGCTTKGSSSDGAIYDPDNDKWNMLQESPLEPRSRHTAVWTGEKMIVWGGRTFSFKEQKTKANGDGASYDPKLNKWSKISDSTLKARYNHFSSYVNDKIIIWGGYGENGAYLSDGAIYDCKNDKWDKVSEFPLEARHDASCVLIGDDLLVWGGGNKQGKHLKDGAAYNLNSAKWLELGKCPVSERHNHTAVSTDKVIIVWGGLPSSHRPSLSDGACYDLKNDKWKKLEASPLKGRHNHTAVWTGKEMIIWGGISDNKCLGDGAVFDIASIDK